MNEKTLLFLLFSRKSSALTAFSVPMKNVLKMKPEIFKTLEISEKKVSNCNLLKLATFESSYLAKSGQKQFIIEAEIIFLSSRHF